MPRQSYDLILIYHILIRGICIVILQETEKDRDEQFFLSCNHKGLVAQMQNTSEPYRDWDNICSDKLTGINLFLITFKMRNLNPKLLIINLYDILHDWDVGDSHTNKVSSVAYEFMLMITFTMFDSLAQALQDWA